MPYVYNVHNIDKIRLISTMIPQSILIQLLINYTRFRPYHPDDDTNIICSVETLKNNIFITEVLSLWHDRTKYPNYIDE